MLKRLFPVAIALSLVACTTDTGSPIYTFSSEADSSSDSKLSSGSLSSGASSSSSALSSGVTASSSSFTSLPDVDSSLAAGPSDLKVSSLVGPKSLVLAWTDVASLPKSSYLGYQIFRNDNYSGWKSVGFAPPQKQFFKDTTLGNTGEYMYLYRVIAYDTADGDTVYRSKYSNEAGSLPITALGFEDVIFDTPENFTMTRWSPSWFRLNWKISALKPELGVVVQKLAFKGGLPTFNTGGANLSVLDSVGQWKSLDTLGENDNYFDIQDSNSSGVYRIYAFYSDEFGRVWSEFSPELLTAEADYHDNIIFKTPLVYTRIMDTATILASWVQQHNNFIEAANSLPAYENAASKYTDTAYYEIEQYVSANNVIQTRQPFSQIQLVKKGLSITDIDNHLCAYAVRVRVYWRDRFGQVDRTEWSNLSGTSGGTSNLADPGTVCPK